jgi:hypothetical protein
VEAAQLFLQGLDAPSVLGFLLTIFLDFLLQIGNTRLVRLFELLYLFKHLIQIRGGNRLRYMERQKQSERSYG